MNRNLKRLLFALIVSTACFLGTVYWFESGLRKARNTDGKAAVARLNESVNEVQRRESKRVIWESISRNDELYPGERIRTNEKAEAKIVLLKSGTVIHLEPESEVVLEENANGLALDFLSGNLFVQGGGNSASEGEGVTLKTGSGEIKLKSADMSLSKDQSGQVNLEVFKGQAELQQGSQKIALAKDKSATISAKGMAENKDRLLLVSPEAGQTILLNLTRGEKLDLTWKPLPPGYVVTAEVGLSRSTLSKVTDSSATGESGRLPLAQKPGKWFVRLTAKSNDANNTQLVSMVTPFTVEPKAAPSLIEPTADAPIVKEKPDQELPFRWINRNRYVSQVLEIAKDSRFQNVSKKQTLAGESSEFLTPLNDGVYFWRVTGYLKVKDKTEPLTSVPHRFEVVSQLEVKPPLLLAPSNHLTLSFTEAQKRGVQLRWQGSPGTQQFKLQVQRRESDTWKTLNEQDLDTTTFKLSPINPGEYRWKVTAFDPKGGAVKASETWDFRIEDLPKVEWAYSEKESEYVYTTPTPTLVGRWKPVPGAASYRYRLSSVEISLSESPWQTTKQDHFDANVKHDGKFLAVVEAYNAKNQLLAESEVKTFIVKRAPLLPAPKWTENTPPILKTDGKGNLSFDWQEVQGARNYLMILEGSDGNPIEQRTVTRTTASVSKLKPGQYRVKLRSVDAFQRSSEESEARKLEVPNTSDIKAPKIKAMKVK